MILRLRQRHRHIVIMLGVILPVVLVTGMALRKPAPVAQSLPEGLITAQKFSTQIWERNELFTKVPVGVGLLSDGANGKGRALHFSAAKDFLKPDLLVYWVAGQPERTDSLPAKAVLLGEFGAVALLLPASATGTNGVLVLYSLADDEVVDVSKSETIGQGELNHE